MKKMFAFGIVVGAILALGVMAFSVYNASSANAAGSAQPGFMPGMGFGRGTHMFVNGPGFNEAAFDMEVDHPLQPYIEETVAEILGISVEALQTAQNDETSMAELLENAGLTAEEFQTALESAIPAIVEEALADGAITQEQADFFLANGLRFFHRHGERSGFGGFGLEGDGILQPYVEAAVAEALGLTVEDLQAAKDIGTRLPELLESAGLTFEEFQTAMDEAVPGIVEQALADGVITQEQADYILENGLRGAKAYLHGALQEYVDAAVADILGVSVEELQTARQDGTVADLIEAAGLTLEEYRTAIEEATPGILEQALEDGVITQPQADYILENGLRGFGFGPGGCGGPGGRGPHGGGFGGSGGWFVPGNPDGSATEEAPTTDTSSGNG